MSSAATEGRFQERAKEHDVRTGNIIAAKGTLVYTLSISILYHYYTLYIFRIIIDNRAKKIRYQL